MESDGSSLLPCAQPARAIRDRSANGEGIAAFKAQAILPPVSQFEPDRFVKREFRAMGVEGRYFVEGNQAGMKEIPARLLFAIAGIEKV